MLKCFTLTTAILISSVHAFDKSSNDFQLVTQGVLTAENLRTPDNMLGNTIDTPLELGQTPSFQNNDEEQASSFSNDDKIANDADQTESSDT